MVFTALRVSFLTLTMFICIEKSVGQKIVPVREEPRHIPVLTNKYIRVINAEIGDGDTSLFHIHETPSAFIFLTDVSYDNQVLNTPWQKLDSKKGYAWYASYQTGGVTHRVGVPHNLRLHAYDIELLSKYAITENPAWERLPYDTAFVSDRCVGYKIELTNENPTIQFSGRGPIIAIMVSGEEVTITQPETRVKIGLEEEDYGYIRPVYPCTIKINGGDKATLVLFEIR
jgi:hypothetical protein